MVGTESADWRAFADCASTDPEIFFPRRGESTASKLAKKICEGCMVQDDCLADAITRTPSHGIRSGYTPNEIYSIKRGELVVELGERATEALANPKELRLRDRYEEAKKLRESGASYVEIAGKIGYASHGGVRALFAKFEGGDED